MGKSSPSQPAPPNPAATAAAQASANKETAIANAQLNQVNQTGPYGGMEWSQRGTTAEGIPQYTVTQTLAPAQQQMLDQPNKVGIKEGETASAQVGQVSNRLAQPLDYSSLGAAPTPDAGYRQQVTQAMLARQQPMMDQQAEAERTRLANMGFSAGSEAYNRDIDAVNRAQNDMRLAIDAQAGNQMAQQYGLESAGRDRAINEMVQQRQIPLNELAAMLTGAQVQGPQFVPTPQSQMAPPDIMGATYGSANLANNAYNTQMQQQTAQQQGLYSLLGAGAQAGAYAWSDRALKTDIEKIGTRGPLNVYSFRYAWGPRRHVGFMADEVEALFPHAVREIGGFKQVDYAEVLECLE